MFVKTAVTFENHIFCHFWQFLAILDIPDGSFEFIIFFVFLGYHDMLGLHTTLNLCHHHKKVPKDSRLLKKITFWLFLAVLDDPDGSFEVLIISDWFHQAACM